MTPAAARKKLPELAARIARTNALREQLYAQRTEAFLVLSDDGMTQGEIAQLAGSGTTTPIVGAALYKARNSGTDSAV